MPRYRTISCSHCGYLQLKRDTECERCGRMTARARNRMIAWLVRVGLVVVVGLVLMAKVKSGLG
jgi:uncharacterized paraquat-inducible protein A